MTKRPPKVEVACARCRAIRYVRPPAPDGYTCQRCQTAAADSVAVRPRDPWTVHDPTNRAELQRARWLLRRKGFLR